ERHRRDLRRRRPAQGDHPVGDRDRGGLDSTARGDDGRRPSVPRGHDAAPGGKERRARALDGRVPRVLRTVGAPLGVPSLAQSATDRGDESLGDEFTELIRPYLFRTELPQESLREIRGIKARIERERLGPREDPKTQIKVGAGGLIDVEFTIQLLQLMHGHIDPRLRNAHGTIPALAAATEIGLLDLEKGRWMVDAYRFLNRVRNALYLIKGRPTDALPSDAQEQDLLARALQYPSPGARNAFIEEYRRTTRRARQVCEDVFYGGRLGRSSSTR